MVRNALRIAAAFVAVCIAACGCASKHIEITAKNPVVFLHSDGSLYFMQTKIAIDELPGCLQSAGGDCQTEICIRVDRNISSPALLGAVMGTLARNGYKRPICITDKRAESSVSGQRIEDSIFRYSITPE